jgi:DNA repair exonuclease SbcCD ATPase subunit
MASRGTCRNNTTPPQWINDFKEEVQDTFNALNDRLTEIQGGIAQIQEDLQKLQVGQEAIPPLLQRPAHLLAYPRSLSQAAKLRAVREVIQNNLNDANNQSIDAIIRAMRTADLMLVEFLQRVMKIVMFDTGVS